MYPSKIQRGLETRDYIAGLKKLMTKIRGPAVLNTMNPINVICI